MSNDSHGTDVSSDNRNGAFGSERYRDDKILSNAMRVRARLGLIHADKSIGLSLPSEIRLLDEIITSLLPTWDGDEPAGQLEGE